MDKGSELAQVRSFILRLSVQVYCCATLYMQVEHVATAFRRVSGLSSFSIAQQIVKDRIGVLVDLMGFTDGGRSEVFALQSAPLQVSYLGFPGMMITYIMYY